MISIKKNQNFSNWFQVFAFGKMIDEFSRRSKAVRRAEELAIQANQKYINVEGLAQKIKYGN
jgi:hypothetical protein